jgi:hypothetical protein
MMELLVYDNVLAFLTFPYASPKSSPLHRWYQIKSVFLDRIELADRPFGCHFVNPACDIFAYESASIFDLAAAFRENSEVRNQPVKPCSSVYSFVRYDYYMNEKLKNVCDEMWQ